MAIYQNLNYKKLFWVVTGLLAVVILLYPLEGENAWVMKLIYNHIENEIRPYTHEERTELLKRAMGEEAFNKAVDELMPFGGGLSEYYDSYKIPYTKN
jgi:hypothetical protein